MQRQTVPTLVAILVGVTALLAGIRPVGAAPPSAGCIDGWTAPDPGSAQYEQGVGILTGYFGLTGVDVSEIRYFTGPDAPAVIEPRFDPTLRWYIVATSTDDPSWRGRFIVEYRDDTRLGVSAAAPFDTEGYRSPDWRAFVGDGPFREVPGLPGLWAGLEYDFVTGEGDTGFPGLPPEVTGCLAAAGALPPTY